MLCSECQSETHFRAHCTKGKGKGNAGGQPAFMTADSWPVVQGTTRLSWPPDSNTAPAASSSSSAGRRVYFSEITFSDGSSEPIHSEPIRNYLALESHVEQGNGKQQKQYLEYYHITEHIKFDKTAIDVLPVFESRSSMQETCYHSQVRLSKGESLVVDTGAPNSLAGSKFIERCERLGKQFGQGTSHVKLEKSFSVGGVGKGSEEVITRSTVPIATEAGVGSFTSNVVNGSEIPGLLGLNPLKDHNALIDTKTGKVVLVGEGGYKLQLSPGSRVIQCQLAPTGHLMMPISEWQNASIKPNQRSVTF
jgi:hypothetical protein